MDVNSNKLGLTIKQYVWYSFLFSIPILGIFFCIVNCYNKNTDISDFANGRLPIVILILPLIYFVPVVMAFSF